MGNNCPHIIVCVCLSVCVVVCFSQNRNKQPRVGGSRSLEALSEPIADIWVPWGYLPSVVIVVKTEYRKQLFAG